MIQATDDSVMYYGNSANREKRADVGLFLNSSKWRWESVSRKRDHTRMLLGFFWPERLCGLSEMERNGFGEKYQRELLLQGRLEHSTMTVPSANGHRQEGG